jgi:hypothetical protein
MKVLFTVLVFISCAPALLAQHDQSRTFNCFVTASDLEEQAQEIIARRPKGTMARVGDDGSIKYIPIKIHWVRNTDGSFGRHNDPNKLFRVFEKVNEIWSDINIQLVVDKDIDFINNTAFLKTVRDSDAYRQLMSTKVAGFANVWMVEGWVGSPASGYGGPAGVELAEIGIQIDGHEFGHFLSLAHTFDTGNGIELVTRDAANGANCSTAGDGICDTAADPYGLQPGQYLGQAPAAANCVMTTNTTDTKGTLYTPPYNNFMSYYGGCGYIFTQGQKDKMRDGYFQYHSTYQLLTSGISGAPANVTVVKENDIDYLTWQPATNAQGFQVEYSQDNGLTWRVMPIVNKGNNKVVLGELTKGVKAKLRARHLNSYTYSAVVDYTPALNLYCIPTTEFKLTTEAGGIGTFTITNTTLDNQTKTNESYSLIENTTPVKLFIGGNYSYSIKPIFNPDGTTAYTYFSFWLDENGDGDFDDAGEQKLVQDKFQYEVTGSFAAHGSAGKTRLRLRSFGNGNTGNPCGFFSESETEDYVVELVNDIPPVITAGAYNATSKNISIQWTDNSTTDGYTVQRSADGLNFSNVGTVAAGQPKSFIDTQFLPDTQYGYRVVKNNSTKYSNEFIVVSGKATISYCTPISDNGCALLYGYVINEFKILEAAFTKNSDGQCPEGVGYTNYAGENPVSLSVGTNYTFNVSGPQGKKFEHVLIAADLDQNGTFDATETLFRYDNQAVPISAGTFSIPATASVGKTVLRVRAFFNPIPDACGRASFGETEDYSIFVSGGKQPTVENLSATATGSNQVKLAWTLPSFASATGIQIAQSLDGTNFSVINNSPATATEYLATGLQAATRYYYRVITVGTNNSQPKFSWATTDAAVSVPAVTVASAVPAFSNSAFTVNFTVSEATTQFLADDLQLTNATASNFSGSGTAYSALITPSALGLVTVKVKANAVLNTQNVGNVESNAIQTTFDNVVPTLSFTALAATNVNTAQRIQFEASELLSGFTINNISAVNGAVSDFHENGGKYNFLLTPAAEGSVTATVAAGALTDRAGNLNPVPYTVSYNYDVTRPTASVTSASPADVNAPFDVQLVLSENSSDFSMQDITVVNATVKLLSTSMNSYNLRMVPTMAGAISLQVAADKFSDTAGNLNTASALFTRNYVPVGLTAVLSSTAADTVSTAFTISINTSAPTTDLVATDLTVVNGTVSAFTGSSSSYTAQITPTSDGTVSVEIEAAKFTDGFNPNLESNQVKKLFDGTSPSVVLSWLKMQASYLVNVTIDEANDGFSQTDINAVKGTVSNFEVHGQNYSFIINIDNTGNAEVEIPAGVFADKAGNPNLKSNLLKSEPEKVAPSILISSSAPPRVNGPFEIEVSASEDVTGLGPEDFVLVNAKVSSVTGNHASFRAQVLPVADGSVQVSLPADVLEDLSGNKNTASNVFSLTYDVTPPTIAVTTAAGTQVTAPFSITLSSSEDVKILTPKEVLVSNGTASDLSGAGRNYTLKITPYAIGEVSVIIKKNSVPDLAGNTNNTEAKLVVNFDHPTQPTVVVGVAEDEFDQVTIYPNPITRWLHIEAPEFSHAKLIAMNGLITGHIVEKQTDLSELAQGLYQLIVYDNNNNIIGKRKVIITR